MIDIILIIIILLILFYNTRIEKHHIYPYSVNVLNYDVSPYVHGNRNNYYVHKQNKSVRSNKNAYLRKRHTRN